jgi:hypothetical protein
MNWTVQGLIDAKMTVAAYCHNAKCGHHALLDLQTLRNKLGPDAEAMADDLTPKLKCAKCGGKQLGLIYAPDTSRQVPNSYLKAKGG